MARRGKKMTPEAVEQARSALRQFRALQPTLNQYARMLTGRPDVRVEAAQHDNGSTDGKTIYYRPPISLGKVMAHQRWLCDTRDEHRIMRCVACAQREDVLVTIYHEIAHIWFDSFNSLTDDAKARAIEAAVREVGTKYGESVRKAIEANDERLGYMGLAGLVSPFLPILLNCLEDARVNRNLFHAMPGTKVMFDANTGQIFREGVEGVNEDGDWGNTLWRDRPLNSQAMIGVFCMASGYHFDDWLNEFVVTALKDDTLVALVNQLHDINDVDSTFTLAFPILARLRELGFCRAENDPEDDFEPPYEEEPEKSDDEPETGDDDEPDDEPAESGASPDGEGEPDEADAADEGDSSGDDPEGSADDDGGDDGSADADDVADDEEGEVDGGSDDGGDSPDEGSDGPEADDGETAESPEGDGSGASDSDPEEGEHGDGDEVPEAGDSSDDGGPDAGDGDSGDLRDGEGAGDDELDGSSGPDSGDSDLDESRRGTDDSSDARVGDVHEGDDGSRVDSDDDADDELIDTGAEKKGIRVDGELVTPVKPRIPWGEAEEVDITVHELGDHDLPTSVEMHDHGDGTEPHTHRDSEDVAGDAVVKAVMVAGMYFEMPSSEVTDVRIKREADGFFNTDYASLDKRHRKAMGIDGDFDPPASVINPVVARARVVFAENNRGRHEVGLRRGRIHSASVGRKAPVGDDTFFKQKRLPGRQDYFVGIGIDVSGSTTGLNINLAKQVAMAEADMLQLLGIPFFVYAHSGDYERQATGWGLVLDIIEIKRADEVWNGQTRDRLRALGPQAANLDGHTIQFYRKMLEQQKATRKILHYYSDGAMPCENFDEELDILRSEIQRYKKDGIILAGVGIRTDAPRQHGLETVIVNEQKDVMAVVEDLAKRLLER